MTPQASIAFTKDLVAKYSLREIGVIYLCWANQLLEMMTQHGDECTRSIAVRAPTHEDYNEIRAIMKDATDMIVSTEPMSNIMVYGVYRALRDMAVEYRISEDTMGAMAIVPDEHRFFTGDWSTTRPRFNIQVAARWESILYHVCTLSQDMVKHAPDHLKALVFDRCNAHIDNFKKFNPLENTYFHTVRFVMKTFSEILNTMAVNYTTLSGQDLKKNVDIHLRSMSCQLANIGEVEPFASTRDTCIACVESDALTYHGLVGRVDAHDLCLLKEALTEELIEVGEFEVPDEISDVVGDDDEIHISVYVPKNFHEFMKMYARVVAKCAAVMYNNDAMAALNDVRVITFHG